MTYEHFIIYIEEDLEFFNRCMVHLNKSFDLDDTYDQESFLCMLYTCLSALLEVADDLNYFMPYIDGWKEV